MIDQQTENQLRGLAINELTWYGQMRIKAQLSESYGKLYDLTDEELDRLIFLIRNAVIKLP